MPRPSVSFHLLTPDQDWPREDVAAASVALMGTVNILAVIGLLALFGELGCCPEQKLGFQLEVRLEQFIHLFALI